MIDLLFQLDTNRDGSLQKTELPPRIGRRFQLLDRNRDGKLNRQEMEVLRRFLPRRRKK